MAKFNFEFFTEHGPIGFVVFAQALLLGLGIIATAFFLVARKYWLAHKLAKQDEYERFLIEFLFEKGPANQPGAVGRPPDIWFWQEASYRDVILHQIQILSGDERAALVKLYKGSGFLSMDRKLLRSRRWWVRLRALIRMDLLCLDECRNSFREVMNDPNMLVSLCATRAVSRLNTDIDDEILFSTLVRVGAKRREAAIEVLSNIGTMSGAARIIRHLEQNPDSPIALACVRVLGDLRAAEATSVFLQILSTPEIFADELIAEVLRSMSKIADPAGIKFAKETLSHTSPLVRATSVKFIQDFGESFTEEELAHLKLDTSVEVRRALLETGLHKEAA